MDSVVAVEGGVLSSQPAWAVTDQTDRPRVRRGASNLGLKKEIMGIPSSRVGAGFRRGFPTDWTAEGAATMVQRPPWPTS